METIINKNVSNQLGELKLGKAFIMKTYYTRGRARNQWNKRLYQAVDCKLG